MTDMLIDITRLLDNALQRKIPTGVDRVGLAYVAHFRSHAKALVRFGGRWIILGNKGSQYLFDALLNPGKNYVWMIRFVVGYGYVFRWWNTYTHAILLNITHSGLNLPRYAQKIHKHQYRAVFFLHDLIPLTHPEYCRAGEAEKHRLRLNTMLSVGRGIIVNSHATLSSLHTFAQKRGIIIPPCIVASLAPASFPAPLRDRPLEKAYFVVLGTIESRKNHLLLLHIWRQLVQELGDAAPRLVIIGKRGWESEQVIDLLERCEALRGIVIEKTPSTDAELSTWLAHARALLFPSFAEGFGIPVVEALIFGVPVIASDLPAFHEIAGDIPQYLDPLDGPAWKHMIIDYMKDNSVYYTAQKQRMQGYVAPTWDEHFAKVKTFLKEKPGDS